MAKSLNEKEIRTLTSPIELRALEEDESKKYIVGYALRFNSESENLGGFIETIDPNALNNTDLVDVRALFNHDHNQVLGRTKANTLKLSVDDFGLRYEIEVPETSYAEDLVNSMKRGDIDQSSFGFIIDHENDGDSWTYNEERDIYLRTIKAIKSITDVSVVTYPAYQATESLVAQRGLEDYKSELQKALKQKQINIELELY